AQLAWAGNRRFTFADGRRPPAASWWRFQATALAGAVLGMVVVAAGVQAGLHYLLAQALATLLVFATGFAVNRHWSFARPPGARPRTPGRARHRRPPGPR
ncbi:hypothetical protein CKO44_17420, partial [Rubrivivax gelatinosus]|uniref:GtrA family protein n=1 Tax=Rubrivivax gelatinosus TaxID=28068 RepID=UPI001907EEC9